MWKERAMPCDSCDFERKAGIGLQPTAEQYRAAVDSAIQARSMVTYLVWKELRERCPEVDATAVLAAAYRRFGQVCGEGWGAVADASEALVAQTSKAGYEVFCQELVELSPDFARKDFARCPHIEAFRRLGATDEEVRELCQDVLSQGDYGNFDPHPGLELRFDARIGAGDDHCSYCVVRTRP
jgi:hypothetical protein